jgi:hypothetical protein
MDILSNLSKMQKAMLLARFHEFFKFLDEENSIAASFHSRSK